MSAPIMPGAEPFSASNGPHGVLVLHGFTGNPDSVRHLAQAFAGSGFSVDCPLLPGHGTSVADLEVTRFWEWALAAEDAYAKIARRSEKVAVAGLSMGGTLALWLMLRYPEIVGGVLVNPLVEPPAESFIEMMQGLLDAGIDQVPGIGSDIAKPDTRESTYESTPIRPALSMFDAVGEIAAHLGEIAAPILLLSSRQDHVVPTSSGDFLAEKAGGPLERVFLEKSFHVATLDYDQAEIEERAVAFVHKAVAS